MARAEPGRVHTAAPLPIFIMPSTPPTGNKKTPKSPEAKSVPGDAPAQGDSRPEALRAQILRHLTFTLARDPHTATTRDWWISTAMAVREHLLGNFIATMGVHNGKNVRRVYYLSLEYLMGRLLESNLYNTGLYEDTV